MSVFETLNGLNRLTQEKDRLLEIAEDGHVSEDEYEDFRNIREMLGRLQVSAATLQLWIDQKIADGEIEKDLI